MFGKPSRQALARLQTEGRRAPATVLAIADQGTSMSGLPGMAGQMDIVLKTRLRVEPEGQPAFEVEKRFHFGHQMIPAPGMQLMVRYDPSDHDAVIVDPAAPAPTVPGMVNLPAGQFDMSGLMATVQQAQAQAGGDRAKLAEAIRSSLGGHAMVIDARALGGGPSEVDQLERLAALHAAGALTDAEFAAEKAKVLAA